MKERKIGKHKYLLDTLIKLIHPQVEKEIKSTQGIDMNNVFNIKGYTQFIKDENAALIPTSIPVADNAPTAVL